MQNLMNKYIPMQLIQFIATSNCCEELQGIGCTKEVDLYITSAKYLGLNVKKKLLNGVHILTVSKRSCLHCLENPTKITLHKDIVADLHSTLARSPFIGKNACIHMSNFHYLSQKSHPIISPMDFPFKDKCLRAVNIFQGLECLSMLRADLKKLLMYMISEQRVIVVNSQQHDLITVMPNLLLTEAKSKLQVFRLLVVEVYEVLASYNSERAATMWGEKLGMTVSCQHRTLSCINSESSIVYTTYEYLLRILMGKNKENSLKHVTHIVLAEVHLRKANTHLLLTELKELLKYNMYLKVILLSTACDNSIYLNYFSEGEILDLSKEIEPTEVFYVDDVRDLLQTEGKKTKIEQDMLNIVAAKELNLSNVSRMDCCLDAYANTPNDAALGVLLLMVRIENEDINYQHSTTGVTALILATSYGNFTHVHLLLQNGADHLVSDKLGRNALSLALTNGNLNCLAAFKEFGDKDSIYEDYNKAFIDIELLSELILFLTNKWAVGNILVFLPRYEYLLRVQYRLLRKRNMGQMPQTIDIHLLHEKSLQTDCAAINNKVNSSIKIILSTSVAEQFNFNFPIAYVIDLARYCYESFNDIKGHRQIKYKFISKDCIARRKNKVDMEKYKFGSYFCLLPFKLMNKLALSDIAELNYIPLERVCLTVKLLNRHAMISEYLKSTLEPPEFERIYKSTLFLKKIGILDELEDVTYLGLRIYDIPVDFQLGKMLVYSVMLQCLDPILTIVTFLANFDPLKLPNSYETGKEHNQNILQQIRLNIKSKREELQDGLFSDHFMFLCLYQKWQNKVLDTPACHTKGLQDEYHFVLDGLLTLIASERTILVTNLRSVGVIQLSGGFSMTNANQKSHVWPLVKASLVAGLYPHILIYNESSNRLKSNLPQKLIAIHPEACLRARDQNIINPIRPANFQTNYIVYSQYNGLENMVAIRNCTLVNPLAVLMFCGPAQLYPRHLCTESFDDGGNSALHDCQIYLDEWLWFWLKTDDAQLLLNTRQYFHHVLNCFLMNCSDVENLRKIQYLRNQNMLLFNSIGKLLSQGNAELAVRQYKLLGSRPKAAPSSIIIAPCIKQLLITSTNVNVLRDAQIDQQLMICQYFVVSIPDYLNNNSVPTNCILPWLHSYVLHLIPGIAIPSKLTYLFMYQKNKQIFPFVFMIKCSLNGCLDIQECFRNNISIVTINNICIQENLEMPVFETNIITNVNKFIGKILLYLFAYKNSLLTQE